MLSHFDEFVMELRARLENDEQRWGDTYLHRPKEGQEDRVFARFRDYYDQWKNGGRPMAWLKIVGNAYIAWLRETHPELSERW